MTGAHVRTAVAIGVFDGVHPGHLALIDATKLAAPEPARAVVLTFDPHPTAVLAPAREVTLIESVATRVRRLKHTGVYPYLVRFDRSFARQSPELFVTRYLRDALHVDHVVVGEGFRFGHRQRGDTEVLVSLGHKHGFSVEVIPSRNNDQGVRVSSSLVRQLFREQRVNEAFSVLGHGVEVAGLVVRGAARGRTLGFPTANLSVTRRLPLPNGIYAGWSRVDGIECRAAISVGTNPTFEADGMRRIEVHLLDTEWIDLYGQFLTVELLHYLRPESRYDGVSELTRQIAADVEATRAVVTLPRSTRHEDR